MRTAEEIREDLLMGARKAGKGKNIRVQADDIVAALSDEVPNDNQEEDDVDE